jgi:hypothetical protein
MPSPNFTDRVGTETQEVSDQVAVLKLYDEVPRIFSEEVIVRLPYAHYGTASVDGLTSPNAYRQWKVNSIYDPDLSNTGGNFQPLGRDTWAGIYNYYKVLKTKIRVRYFEADTASLSDNSSRYASLHGGLINLNASPPASDNLWLMASHAGNSNLQQVFTDVEMYNPNGSRDIAYKEYNMEWDPTLLQSAIIDQSAKDTWTPVGSDPDNLEYFSQLVYNPNNTITPRRIVYITEITFMVAFKQVNVNLYNTLN